MELERGWSLMEKGIQNLINILEENTDQGFPVEEHSILYTTIYNLCTQRFRKNYSQELYDGYKERLQLHVNDKVLPALREKHDEFRLRELIRLWEHHKVMVRWLSRFFAYLDRYFVSRCCPPTLKDAGLICFKDLAYQEVKHNVKDVLIALIGQEPEGEQLDRTLLKNVMGILVEIGMGQMECYENDFESPMLEATTSYYSRKAASWILEDSCPEYMLKAEECLKMEKERAAHYLHSSSEQKLLEKVQNELLSQYESQLLEKEHSGCHALLRDDKVEDLSRMHRLFSRIPNGLEPVAAIFR